MVVELFVADGVGGGDAGVGCGLGGGFDGSVFGDFEGWRLLRYVAVYIFTSSLIYPSVFILFCSAGCLRSAFVVAS